MSMVCVCVWVCGVSMVYVSVQVCVPILYVCLLFTCVRETMKHVCGLYVHVCVYSTCVLMSMLYVCIYSVCIVYVGVHMCLPQKTK